MPCGSKYFFYRHSNITICTTKILKKSCESSSNIELSISRANKIASAYNTVYIISCFILCSCTPTFLACTYILTRNVQTEAIPPPFHLSENHQIK
mmetsp:Transcript_9111/g.13494  ORF Transcript_9111/g.13494 Transcript_9111/m.13494 type:complete len:95 (+) Transcript_9111:217-501(+)